MIGASSKACDGSGNLIASSNSTTVCSTAGAATLRYVVTSTLSGVVVYNKIIATGTGINSSCSATPNLNGEQPCAIAVLSNGDMTNIRQEMCCGMCSNVILGSAKSVLYVAGIIVTVLVGHKACAAHVFNCTWR